MAITTNIFATPGKTATLILVTQVGGNVGQAANDIMGGPCRLHHCLVGNGDPERLFLKLFDDLRPTLGSTQPDHIFPIGASGTIAQLAKGGKGLLFETGLSLSLQTEPGVEHGDGPTILSKIHLICRRVT
jgi:hypothetical protein